MASNSNVLEFVLTINRSTMASYQKIIKGFFKNPLVFKWELFKVHSAAILY